MPVWYSVKTFERMGRNHPWEVYALVLPSAQRGCLCLWRSVFKALKWGLCFQHLSQNMPGGTERHMLPLWLSGNLHISFLAPKRIGFNSGPLSRCHRCETAINNKKSHTQLELSLGEERPRLSAIYKLVLQEMAPHSPTTNFCLVKLTFAALCLR